MSLYNISVRPNVAVSACLMGQEVRFDGGHKKSSMVQGRLAETVDLFPLCPEVGIGLGVPRAPIRLVNTEKGTRVKGSKDSSLDVTEAISGYADRQKSLLEGMDGYIMMQKSPSCGVFRVKVYSEDGTPVAGGEMGVYAKRVNALYPDLPMEEAGRLHDPVILDNFITRVFCHADWRLNVACQPSLSALRSFHSRHKLLLKMYSSQAQVALGRLLADADEDTLDERLTQYKSGFMSAIQRPAKRSRHCDALRRLAKLVRKTMTREEKAEWDGLVESYQDGIVPLAVPLALLKHYALREEGKYIRTQSFIQPHPAALGLRSAI